MALPHPDPFPPPALNCAVFTLSDTRTAATDTSGQWILQRLAQAGHTVGRYEILPDDPVALTAALQTLSTPHRQSMEDRPNCQVIILTGGTGIAPRDCTYEVVAPLLDKTLPGFGELFRFLSYQEIGTRALASRALGGTYQGKLLFALPGSLGAVTLAMEKLILPELPHLANLVNGSQTA